ncbi:MAG: UvrB/UvrC motif-containing protein [Elusimicrobiota bacterium]
MLCDICKKREANVFIKKMVNGKIVEYNLCEVCASEMMPSSIDFSGFDKDFFSGLSDMLAGFSDIEQVGKIEKELKCEKCGTSFGDFQKRGRLGCDRCYDTFSDKLEVLLNRLQGSAHHSGKSPPNIEKKMEIGRLKKDLQDAVEKEEYERAAVIRDKIRDLEKKKSNEA